MRKHHVFYLPIVILFSCIKIQGELKGLYSYYDKTDKMYPGLLIKPLAGVSLCAVPSTKNSKVIIANGAQLKTCVENYKHAVVYVWSPLCSGAQCYAINVVQRQCNSKGLELFIVAEYYDGKSMEADYETDHPIFGIDTQFYRTSLTKRYLSKFFYDLTGEKNEHMRFIHFKNGKVVRAHLKLEDL